MSAERTACVAQRDTLTSTSPGWKPMRALMHDRQRSVRTPLRPSVSAEPH
jgi:hypothetical protein